MKPPNPRVDPSYDDDSDDDGEGGRPPNAPGGPPPPPPHIDPVDFPLPVTPPPRSPVLERTPRRELSERRRGGRRERDQSCEPSGSGTQRNDAQRRADRERSPRESMRAHTLRRESHTPATPRVEKCALSDQEEQPADSPEKGERVKTGGKKARSGTLWQQAKDSKRTLDSSDEEMDGPGIAALTRTLRVPVKRGAKLPHKGTEESAGYDIYSPTCLQLPPQQQTCIPLKLQVKIPPGYFLKLYGCSSIERAGVILLACVVDSDYTGEIQAVFWNLGRETVTFNKGQKICQGVFHQCYDIDFNYVDRQPATSRGAGGFSSTD